MEKITRTVKLVYVYTYYSYFTYQGEEHYKYIMRDSEGKAYVWDTQNGLYLNKHPGGKTIEDGYIQRIDKGDVFTFTAFVKGEKEYKGELQTLVVRLKVNSIESKAPTKEDKEAEKQKKQLESLEEGDEILYMTYKNYKERYSDCETLSGSFETVEGKAYIRVIVRCGRLKASGSRGQHYTTFLFRNVVTGQYRTIKAISEETGRRQLKRQGFNESEFEIERILY